MEENLKPLSSPELEKVDFLLAKTRKLEQ